MFLTIKEQLLPKKRLEGPVSDNVDGKANNNVDELVIDSEADKFLVLFEKIFNEKLIEQENIAQDSDAEDGAIQDILIRIANKISEKIENSTGENKTLNNRIWIGCVKLSLLRREYLSSAVNVLRNNLKIFDST